MPIGPIDPLSGPRYALEGKIVTMDQNNQVLDKGVVYIDAGQIVAVNSAAAPCPPGFENSLLVKTRANI